MKSEELGIGLLREYKAYMHLKENNHSIYFESRKMPIHILSMVRTQSKKNVEQSILAKVPKVVAVGLHQLFHKGSQMEV